jgi:hypothetical protein
VQVFGLIIFFSFRQPGRVHELLLAAMLSMIVCTGVMVLLPAVGAWSQHGVGMMEPWRHDVLALRSHTLMTIGKTEGIISFPSYHAVLGILFANHYGVDMLGGGAVAFLAIVATRSMLARCSQTVTPAQTRSPPLYARIGSHQPFS